MSELESRVAAYAPNVANMIKLAGDMYPGEAFAKYMCIFVLYM